MEINEGFFYVLIILSIIGGALLSFAIVKFNEQGNCFKQGKEYIGGRCIDLSQINYCKTPANDLYIQEKPQFSLNIT